MGELEITPREDWGYCPSCGAPVREGERTREHITQLEECIGALLDHGSIFRALHSWSSDDHADEFDAALRRGRELLEVKGE